MPCHGIDHRGNNMIEDKIKNISIIGSTGSIGTQTLEVVDNNMDMRVVALSCGSNIKLLEQQARKYKPELIAVWSDEDAASLRVSLADMDVKVESGMQGLIDVASYEKADITVTAIVGMIGIEPTLAAIKAGKDIALANKETLVTAGHLVIDAAEERGVSILPVDSEHSAIFQCLQGNRGNKLSRILLTASGGPFRGKKRAELENVTIEQALNHPNWSMGAKITIDSATMVNKGLEVIEAKWLFNVASEQIEVIIQPQSIIHSAVEYQDGAVIAQLGTPDMKLPIQYALCYPYRRALPGDRLDFSKISEIKIEKPDRDTFKGLDFAYSAIKTGGSMPTVLNAANEYAVAKFLKGDIRFLEIYDMIEYAMACHEFIKHPELKDILETQKWTEEILKTKWN